MTDDRPRLAPTRTRAALAFLQRCLLASNVHCTDDGACRTCCPSH